MADTYRAFRTRPTFADEQALIDAGWLPGKYISRGVASAQNRTILLQRVVETPPQPDGPFEPLVASGGTVRDVVIDGYAYRVHTFEDDGQFQVDDLGSYAGAVEYLLVGGGGAGGGANGGAGGAGGLLTNFVGGNRPHRFAQDLRTQVGTYNVVVGAGGLGEVGAAGADGAASSALGLTALGGGGADGDGGRNGLPRTGGSGAGAAPNFDAPFQPAPPAGGTEGQGRSGGIGISRIDGDGFDIQAADPMDEDEEGEEGEETTPPPEDPSAPAGDEPRNQSGGGGGAGASGVSAPNDDGCDGGEGRLVDIDGDALYYAGGGGGSIDRYRFAGRGGTGGGGGGAHTDANGRGFFGREGGGQARNAGGRGGTGAGTGSGGDGGALTGGGGGAGAAGATRGGHGGSGIFVVRYPLERVELEVRLSFLYRLTWKCARHVPRVRPRGRRAHHAPLRLFASRSRVPPGTGTPLYAHQRQRRRRDHHRRRRQGLPRAHLPLERHVRGHGRGHDRRQRRVPRGGGRWGCRRLLPWRWRRCWWISLFSFG